MTGFSLIAQRAAGQLRVRKTELTLGLTGFRQPNIYSIFVLQKNASIMRRCSIVAPKAEALGASGIPSRRPRSPSCDHNVKQRRQTIFASKFNGEHRF